MTPIRIAALAVTVTFASGASAQQILPQEFPGAQGKYEMCIKRHVLELRKARGKAMEPLDEIASAQVACKRQAPKGDDAGDVISTIMECGVARGDGVVEHGCPQ